MSDKSTFSRVSASGGSSVVELARTERPTRVANFI